MFHNHISYFLVVFCFDIIYLTITPQVTLGEIHGIDKNTRADFMIKCSSIMRNGEQVEDSNELNVKNIE